MSDLAIIGIIVLFMFIGVIRMGWRAGRHLNAPTRKEHSDNQETRIEDLERKIDELRKS